MLIKREFLLLATIFSAIFPGCTGVRAEMISPRTNQESPATQIILKFKDPVFDPSVGNYLRMLSNQTGANIIYVRPMSGDAHVLRIEGAGNGGGLRRVMDGISTRPEVEWVEQDRIMRHQSR